MSGGEKSARAESFAFVIKRCRGALLAGTAVVAAPAFLALSLGAAQAGDLVNDFGTYVNHGTLTVDDVSNGSGGRIINKGKLTAAGSSTTAASGWRTTSATRRAALSSIGAR